MSTSITGNQVRLYDENGKFIRTTEVTKFGYADFTYVLLCEWLSVVIE